MERQKASEGNIRALEAEFEKLLGRLVGLKIPDMFLPPIYEDIIMREVVHLDPLLNRNTDHLTEAHIDEIIIEKRLEILALAKRHRLINLRLAGEIVRENHEPDCRITILADIEQSRHYFDEREVLGLEIRLGDILKRNVTILIPDRMIPPLYDDYYKKTVTL
jgi:predicted nucleotidyltransferase